MANKETKNFRFRISKGKAAAHIYLIIDNIDCCQLILDWSYDGAYFKYYNDNWIILSLGAQTQTHDIHKINSFDKLKTFKLLIFNLDELKDYSIISNKSLSKIKSLLKNSTFEYIEMAQIQ